MHLGRVTGTVVATRKDERLEGLKLYVVDTLDLELRATGAITIAVDAVGAGEGEIVLVASGSSARLTQVSKDRPVDAVIVGIVDTLESHGKLRFSKSEPMRVGENGK